MARKVEKYGISVNPDVLPVPDQDPKKMITYTKDGGEVLDATPVALPVGFRPPKTIQETIQALIRNEEFRKALDKLEMDTFEEADDFETEESDEDAATRHSPYEMDFDPMGTITRNHEIASGFVEEIPQERKKRSAELVQKMKEALIRRQAPQEPKAIGDAGSGKGPPEK